MKNILTFSLSLAFTLGFAQIKQGDVIVNGEEQIKQGEVTVQRNYEPNVSAMEKIKQVPSVTPPKTKKQTVNYDIKDIEAASDFKTMGIQPEKLPVKDTSPYKNYIKAGYGNNATLKADLFLNHSLDSDKSIGLNASFLGTKANLKKYNIFNNTNESKFNGEGFFNYNLENALFSINAGVDLHRLNLYGIPTDETTNQSSVENVMQRFIDVSVGGNYNVYNHGFLKNLNAKAYYFNNNFGSNELGFQSGGTLNTGDMYEADFLGGLILGAKSDINLNYSHTLFNDGYDAKTNFNYFNIGAKPQAEIKNDFMQLAAGVNLQYVNETANKNSRFHLFPDAQVRVITAPEFNIYGGVTGGIKLNTYKSLANKNPYIHPSLVLKPTINQFEIYAGINGDIGTNFKYNAKAGFQDLKEELFFVKSSFDINPKAFGYANSFIALYDNAKRTYIDGSLHYLGIDKLSLGADLHLQTYQLNSLENAFEKPFLSGEVNAQYSILDNRLLLGSTLLFKGKRKASTYPAYGSNGINQPKIVDLKPYVDLNFNTHFLFNNQWVIFVEANNIFNNNYERFVDYRVQGFTILGGVQYKF